MSWFLIFLLGYLAIGAMYGIYELSTQGTANVGWVGFFTDLLAWPVSMLEGGTWQNA